MRLVLFDFDHTLTQKDSFVKFLRFSTNGFMYFLFSLVLLPELVRYRKSGDGERRKKKVLKKFYRGKSRAFLDELGERFVAKYYATDSNYKQDVWRKFQEHKENGDRIVVASASMDLWIRPWCELQNVEYVCTELGFWGDSCTGELIGKNCQGEEKKRRIATAFDLSTFSEIVCFGNPGDDDAMLELGTEKHIIPR